MAAPRRLSPSALERFHQCPKRYRLQDLEGHRPPFEPSPTLAVANAVHHALERFYGLADEHRRPENLERALRAVWPEHRQPGTFRNVDEEIRAGQSALQMLRRFATRSDLYALPLAREQWLDVEIAGVRVYGKVDRIDPVAGGGLELVDYKTSRRAPELRDLRHESAIQAYVTAAELAYAEPVVAVRLSMLMLDEDIVWQLEPNDAQELRDKLSSTIHEIAEEQTFTARPGPHCRFCPFQLRCPERTHVELEDLVPIVGLPFDLEEDDRSAVDRDAA